MFAACCKLPPSGGGGSATESFTFITLSCGCRNLPKKYATSFLILRLPPFSLWLSLQLKCNTHTQIYTENLLAHRLIRQELWQHTLRLTFKLPLMRSRFLTRLSLTPSQLAANHGNYSSSRRVCNWLNFLLPLPFPFCSCSIKNLFNVARRIPGNKQRMS